uniref:Uncharacterized protein n=1 Tax=Moniliophthora roreri TaxID=221103 RepID=A0A0W0F5I1_MONRR
MSQSLAIRVSNHIHTGRSGWTDESIHSAFSFPASAQPPMSRFQSFQGWNILFLFLSPLIIYS